MIAFGTLPPQKPSYSLCKTHLSQIDLFAIRSRKWFPNGLQNGSIFSSFPLSFSTPFLNPLQISFLPKPTRREEPKGPKRRKRETKMEPKWDPKTPMSLHFYTPGAAWCPPGAPEASRNTQDLIFIDSGSIFAPPSLRFIDFWLPFSTSKGPSTAKNSQEPPRTCQEPAETQNPQRHTAPKFADRRTAPTATKRRARIRGAAVGTPHGVFNNPPPPKGPSVSQQEGLSA